MTGTDHDYGSAVANKVAGLVGPMAAALGLEIYDIDYSGGTLRVVLDTPPGQPAGVNLDDLGDHRPGQRAAADRGAVFPLVDSGFTKAMVREASRRLGLRIWDKPAAACLSSRVPYGTSVTVGVLGRIDRAEAALVALGFHELRVRHYGDTARLEVPIDDLTRVLEHRDEVVQAVRAAGYGYVTVDLEGLRSGNLNDALGR